MKILTIRLPNIGNFLILTLLDLFQKYITKHFYGPLIIGYFEKGSTESGPNSEIAYLEDIFKT
jgi:hypothetical protein